MNFPNFPSFSIFFFGLIPKFPNGLNFPNLDRKKTGNRVPTSFRLWSLITPLINLLLLGSWQEEEEASHGGVAVPGHYSGFPLACSTFASSPVPRPSLGQWMTRRTSRRRRSMSISCSWSPASTSSLRNSRVKSWNKWTSLKIFGLDMIAVLWFRY